MLTTRQLLLGLFAIAALLVDFSIISSAPSERTEFNTVFFRIVIGTAIGQVGLLGVFLALGPGGFLIRFGAALVATRLCSELADRFDGAKASLWYWFCLIHLLSVAIPLMIAKSKRQFTLASLFAVTTGVSVLLGLFRFLDVGYEEHWKPIVVAILLAAIAWISTGVTSLWKSFWPVVGAVALIAPVLGTVVEATLGSPEPVLGAIVTTFQGSWLLAGLLIARISKGVEQPSPLQTTNDEPVALTSASSSKSDFSPRIW